MSRKIQVVPGEKYGKLTVIKEIDPYVSPKGKKDRRVLCSCDCDGKEVEVSLGNLKKGYTKSCGCIKKPIKIKVVPGEKYGRLTVIKEVETRVMPNGRKERYVLCSCDCDGKEVIVSLRSMRQGSSTSCGCIAKETASKTKKKKNKYKINGDGTVTGYTLKGEEFYLDEEDLPKIEYYCWGITSRGYVSTRNPATGKDLRLHRFIMECPDDMIVDHINRNPLDNRKENLRICTQSENTKNKSKQHNNKSGVVGVHWDKQNSKWKAEISIKGKKKSLGYFSNKQDAIEARLKAELEHYGTFSPNYEKLTQQQSNQQSQHNT